MSIRIRPQRGDESSVCETVLRALPDWFGIESSLVQYVRDTQRWPTWIAEDGSQPLGFVTLHPHFERAAEIHCIGVIPTHHRSGVGRALVACVESECRRLGVEYLQVKTLGPSRPCAFYAKTRAFYDRVGFVPLEEFLDLWPGNPCLLLVKRVK